MNNQYSSPVIYMNLFYLIIVFSSMLIFTCLMVHTIFASRNRVQPNHSLENAQFKKDLKLSITSISFNVFFVVSYMPLAIINAFFPQIDDIIYHPFLNFFFISSSANFYILLFLIRCFVNVSFLFLTNQNQSKIHNKSQNKMNQNKLS